MSATSCEGQIFLALLNNPEWISHKTTNLRFLDLNISEQYVSAGIDVPKLLNLVDSIEHCITDCFLIPVALLPKGILFDFDISDGSGNRLRTESLKRSLDIGFEAVRCALRDRWDKLPDVIRTRIETLVLSPGDPENEDHLYYDSWDREDLKVWKSLVGDSEFSYLLNSLTKSRPIIIDVRRDESLPRIIKYRLAEPLAPQFDPNWWERLGLVPYAFAPGISTAFMGENNNFRVNAPDGMLMANIGVLVQPHERYFDRAEESFIAPEKFRFRYRLAVDSGVVALREILDGDYHLMLRLVPRIDRFYVPAAMAIFTSNVLLTILGIRIYTDNEGTIPWNLNVFPNGYDSQSVITLIVLVPTIIAMTIVVSGEQGIARRLLTGPRLLVYGIFFLQLLYALLSVIGINGDALNILGIFAISASWVGCIVLITSCYRFFKFRSQVRKSGATNGYNWIFTLEHPFGS